ncbi:sulfite exporter TauE/SafE family protein [Nocardiopsis coralliicola]
MIDALPLLLAFGCLTGLTTVLFGFGGGFITVPVVYAYAASSGSGGEAMHIAVATSTAVMIVNAASATLAQYRAGRLQKRFLWPLIAYIAAGALLGALAVAVVDPALQKALFALYLAVTIVDSIVRKGFLTRSGESPAAGLHAATASAGGLGVGAVAAFLGVGGSVLTVPLLRRRGLTMAQSTAMANPLTLPVALIGTAVYAVLGDAAAPGRIGYVDLFAAAALLAASLPTIAVAKRLIPHIPDRVHAAAYVALLIASLAAILLV